MIEIIEYESKYQPDFKRLNLEWLDKYNLTESHDLEILDDPEGFVIARGGCIFLAIDGEKIIGSSGLWKENESEYELIKMAVETGDKRQEDNLIRKIAKASQNPAMAIEYLEAFFTSSSKEGIAFNSLTALFRLST